MIESKDLNILSGNEMRESSKFEDVSASYSQHDLEGLDWDAIRIHLSNLLSTLAPLSKCHTLSSQPESSIVSKTPSSSCSELIRFCKEATQIYSKTCLRVIELIKAALIELDEEIKDFYGSNDDANYFYVRRRMKFLESTHNMAGILKYETDIRMMANYNIVMLNSELDLALGQSAEKECESFKCFVYTMMMRDVLGPTLILLREMMNMPKYVGVSDIANIKAIQDIHQELMKLTTSLGYKITDVNLFAPMPVSEGVECVGVSDVELDGLESGCVYEIVKLAVLYSSYTTTTEVKVKK